MPKLILMRILTPSHSSDAGTGNRTQIEGGSHDDFSEEEHHKPTCYHYTIPALDIGFVIIVSQV